MSTARRRYPIGAELQPGGGTHFRVWCPDHTGLAVAVECGDGRHRETPLTAEPGGYWSVHLPDAGAGSRYGFRVNGDLLADPASRSQPDGPLGLSEVIDPAAFAWTDHEWHGRSIEDAVIYELHCGTFSADGTWRGAMRHLPLLAELGITVIEVMPVSDFPGRFGWGYDGVLPFAPTRLYGTPDDFRAFVDRAHAAGLAVILDVVYNHFGPEGCVFSKYAGAYFSDTYDNEWGEALNFDGEGSRAVREYFTANARYWIDEYHLDGLRLDATQSIHDSSPEHVIAEIARAVRQAGGRRQTLLVSENEPQDVRLIRPPAEGGFGLDAQWNDDFHHSAVVALTGRAEAYYTDHRGTPQEFVSASKYGYLFQGQRYAWQKKGRGTRTTGVPLSGFVNFIENHDQVANSGDGSRLHRRTTPGRYRAMSALFILMPGTPMLFQGQEFLSSRPFLYFADHAPDLAAAVQKGRADFVAQFPSLASAQMQAALAAPHDPDTFERCKLEWREREDNGATWALYRDLLRLRRDEPAFGERARGRIDGAVLGAEAFVLHCGADGPGGERLLVVNFGADLVSPSLAEPLVAPPEGMRFTVQWSSEDPAYGGAGTPEVVDDGGWRIPGHAAVVLRPELVHDSDRAERG
jgi:maltooligosyltrehalose trehalohydrolase